MKENESIISLVLRQLSHIFSLQISLSVNLLDKKKPRPIYILEFYMPIIRLLMTTMIIFTKLISCHV